MKRIGAFVLMFLFFTACSTTRTLSPGEYRLAKNEIVVSGGDRNLSSELTPYLRQQSNSYFLFGWNPLLNVYNWSRKENSIFHKLGTAPVVFDSNAVMNSCENIQNHLRNLGYYNSKVSAEQKAKGKLMTVRYNITPGKRFPIAGVRFVLPSAPNGEIPRQFREDFYADTSNVLPRAGELLSSRMLEAESARSAAYFQEKGYFRISSNNYSFEADTLSVPGKAFLEYRINAFSRGGAKSLNSEFGRYRVGKVSISYPQTVRIREDILRDLNLLTPGMTYSNRLVSDTYSRLSSLRLFSNVDISLKDAPENKVDYDIVLSPSKLQGFKVNLEGSFTSTGLFGVSPKLNFYHKNIFGGGEWLDLGFSGNFQFKPSESTRATEFGVNADLSFPRPFLFPIKWWKGRYIPRSEIKASYNYQNRPEFNRSVFAGAVGYTGRIGENLNLQVYPLQVSYVYLDRLSDSFRENLIYNPQLYYSFSSHIDAGVGATVTYVTSPDIVPKDNMHYHRLAFDISGNLLSAFNFCMSRNEIGERLLGRVPYSQYVRVSYDFGKTLFIGARKRHSLAFHFNAGAGYAYGNSDGLPFEKQFFCGGASSMRGWQARSLGPAGAALNEVFTIPSQSGDLKFELDLEYRARLFWKIEGALFAEAGNIWNLQHQFDLSFDTLAADWGAGLRVNLDFIVLRLDLGLKIYDPSQEAALRWRGPDRWFKDNGYALHFGVGYPF